MAETSASTTAILCCIDTSMLSDAKAFTSVWFAAQTSKARVCNTRRMISAVHRRQVDAEEFLTGIAEDVVAVLSVARVQQDAPGLAASAAMDLIPADGDLHAGCLDDAPQNVEPGDGTSG